MVKITIDGKIYEVEPGKNLLHTCLALGFDIPYFCFHPALGSVGACRQCAVKKYKDSNDKKGRIVMSCMEPVTDGLIISIDDEEVKDFRRAVIESLMTNHPHDCPVCDEGGECHLQDMTVMTGHNYRRFDFKKRTYRNQDLGPYIDHEMNRCIQCYRCVRFYREYAGGKDLHVFGSAAHVYFGRDTDGKLESPFSGNLVEVCPTGVFTDKTFGRHYTRKWDLTNSPSVCNSCSVGCNILVSERYGMVRRIRSRYNHEVNGYFLCDRGRFSYEYINSPERIRKISLKSLNYAEPGEVPHDSMMEAMASALKNKKVAGVGSPTASLESNFALERLVGKENFYHGIPDVQYNLVKAAVKILKEGAAYSASLKDIERSDAVLILGEDLLASAPMAGLAVRQASRNESFRIAEHKGVPSWNDAAVRDLGQKSRSPVFIASQSGSDLDELASEKLAAPADSIVALAIAIASFIDRGAPIPRKRDKETGEMAQRIATALMKADNPVIITGASSGSLKLLYAAANIATALSNAGKKTGISIIFPHCNSLGLGLMDGKPFSALAEESGKGGADTLVILENELYALSDKEKVDDMFNKFNCVFVLNHSGSETTKRADMVLPSGTFAESTGTIINYEGRAQRYYSVLPEDGIIKDSWKHISEMMKFKDSSFAAWENFDSVVKSLTEAYPAFSKIREMLPDSYFRCFDNEKIARQTPRYSGRTAMNAAISVHEPKPPEDNDSPLKFSMEGYQGVPPAELVPYYWSPGWNSPQAMNKYMNEPGGYQPDGNPGVLLFDKNNRKADYFKD